MRYLHAEAMYAVHPMSEKRSEDAPHALWRPFVEHGVPLPREMAVHEPIRVSMNHGRWIVKCPWCGSAQYASVTDHRFFCVDCGNKGQGWAKTVWPRNADQIETDMDLREPLNRNLDVGETAKTIRDENLVHFGDIVRSPEERLAEAERIAERMTAGERGPWEWGK